MFESNFPTFFPAALATQVHIHSFSLDIFFFFPSKPIGSCVFSFQGPEQNCFSVSVLTAVSAEKFKFWTLLLVPLLVNVKSPSAMPHQGLAQTQHEKDPFSPEVPQKLVIYSTTSKEYIYINYINSQQCRHLLELI